MCGSFDFDEIIIHFYTGAPNESPEAVAAFKKLTEDIVVHCKDAVNKDGTLLVTLSDKTSGKDLTEHLNAMLPQPKLSECSTFMWLIISRP